MMKTHTTSIPEAYAFRPDLLFTGIQLIWTSLLLVGFIASPESPRFLAHHGRWDEAKTSLARLRGLPEEDEDIAIEMEEIRLAKEDEEEMGDAKYSECFSMKDSILLRTMIGLAVQIGQQVTGESSRAGPGESRNGTLRCSNAALQVSTSTSPTDRCES